MVYLIEDNGYAISVPVEVNTAGGSISKLARLVPRPLDPRGRRVRPAAPRSRRYRAAAAHCRAAPRPGARPRSRHPPLQPFALGRRDATTRPRTSATRKRSAIRCHDLPRAAGPRGDRRRERSSTRSTRSSTRRSTAAADRGAGRAAARAGVRARATSTRPTVDPTTDAFATEPHPTGQPDDDGRPPQRVHAATRCGATRASSSSAQDVADASRAEALGAGQGQGRRVQGHLGPAEGIRRRRASSTRRSPRRTSSAARSAWRCAG